MHYRAELALIEREARNHLAKLGAQAHYPTLRSWMRAQAMLPQAGIPPHAILGKWLEEMISEDVPGEDVSDFLRFAANTWLPLLCSGDPVPADLLDAEGDLFPQDEARLRRDEVAGFLDGLLNRPTDPPRHEALLAEIDRLEAIEELLDFLAVMGGSGGKAADVVIESLNRAVKESFTQMALTRAELTQHRTG